MKAFPQLLLAVAAAVVITYKIIHNGTGMENVLGLDVPGYLYVFFWSFLLCIFGREYYRQNWGSKAEKRE